MATTSTLLHRLPVAPPNGVAGWPIRGVLIEVVGAGDGEIGFEACSPRCCTGVQDEC